MKKLFILDIDGTLVNSKARHYLLMGEILKKRGIELNAEEFMEYKFNGGSGLSYLTDKLGLSEHDAKAVNDEWVANIESKEYLLFDRRYTDTIHFINTIIKNEDELVYLTARHMRKNTLNSLQLLGLSPYTEGVIIVEPANAKESKKNAIGMLAKKGMKPIIVGDMETEYEIGKELGIDTYILNRGFRSKEFLDAKGIESYDGLEAIEKAVYKED